MKNWIIFKKNVDCFLSNCESLGNNSDDLAKHSKTLAREGFFRDNKKPIADFIEITKIEISEYLINSNSRDLSIDKIKRDFEIINDRLESLKIKYKMENVENLSRFVHSYFKFIQPIYDFYDWFLLEIGLLYNVNGRIERVIKENTVDETINEIPDIELKTQKEQIRMLYELGVIDFLKDRYPNTLKRNNNQVAILLSQVLKLNRTSLQPTVNQLLNDDAGGKNYPKITNRIKSVIDQLNSNESN